MNDHDLLGDNSAQAVNDGASGCSCYKEQIGRGKNMTKAALLDGAFAHIRPILCAAVHPLSTARARGIAVDVVVFSLAALRCATRMEDCRMARLPTRRRVR